MTDWKEVPHLFANGKFKIQYGDIEKHISIFNAGWLEEIVEEPILNDYYTLIARKIEDMSDEELLDVPSFKERLLPANMIKKMLIRYAGEEALSGRDERYLMSKRVYPFDQNDFGETVIDVKEIE